LQNGAEKQGGYEQDFFLAGVPRPAVPFCSPSSVRLFDIPTTPAELARHSVLSPENLLRVRATRCSMNRLGFAVKFCLLRYPSQGLGLGQQSYGRTWVMAD